MSVKQMCVAGGTLILLSGCASPMQIAQSASSARVGCAPSEVTITEHQISFSSARNWVVTCNGQAYRCSGVSTGYGGYADVVCTKMPPK
jgi:hypothetical protein